MQKSGQQIPPSLDAVLAAKLEAKQSEVPKESKPSVAGTVSADAETVQDVKAGQVPNPTEDKPTEAGGNKASDATDIDLGDGW